MVLCKFFQQGSCRFGSKCANEHLDVKQMVKTDVEAALNGKQWPLSSYGPFRDKPSVPNFIEDQSFEEVRLLCYEAKQKNFFDQFHQQFNKEALEASNKMKALLQMTPNIVDVLISVYDIPSDTSSNGVTVGKTINNASNPFGLANSATSSAGSIFAKSAANTTTNNIFASNNNTFPAPTQGVSGIFANASGLGSQQQTSIFGQVSKPESSIFAGGNNNNAEQNNPNFGQQQTHSNLFASSTQQPSMSTGSGLFSQQNQFLLQTHQNSNIFRQATQTSQPQQGLFAQASQAIQQTQPQQGLFAQAAQTSAAQGLFTQTAQQAQTIFGQALQQQQTNPNIFQQNLSNSGPQQQQTNSNIFQQNQSIMAQQQQIQHPASALFQQASMQMTNPVGQTNQLSQVDSNLYSRLEDLTADEIEAFKADCFQPGKIPFNAPPRELIN